MGQMFQVKECEVLVDGEVGRRGESQSQKEVGAGQGDGHRKKLLVGLAAGRCWGWGTASPSSGLVQGVRRPDLVSGIQ